ncbi:MAG: hypothetical protein AB1801_21760, partial [Chloroflexota bacterium]
MTTQLNVAKQLRSFLIEEFTEVPHPFNLSDPSRTYRFSNIELTVDILLSFLLYECDEERLRSVGDEFLAAFQDFNNTSYTDTINRSRAAQDLAIRFESFLKKVAYYRYPNPDKPEPNRVKNCYIKQKEYTTVAGFSVFIAKSILDTPKE